MASIVSEKIAWGQVLFAESRNPRPPIRFWPISMQPCANVRNESSEYETLSKACKRLLFGFLQKHTHTHTHFNSISEVVTKLEQITRGHCTCGNQGFPELVYLGHPNNETWPSCGMEQHYRILSPHCIDLEQDFHEDDDHNMRSSQARPRCMFMCTYVYMHIYISGEFAFELVFAKAIKHFTYLFQNKHWC